MLVIAATPPLDFAPGVLERKIYTDRIQAHPDVFDYIEFFYNPQRRRGFNNQLSPVEFERQYFLKNGTV